MWGYITTYRTMQPLWHPVGQLLTTQTLEVGMVRAQANRCKLTPRQGNRVNIWEVNVYPF